MNRIFSPARLSLLFALCIIFLLTSTAWSESPRIASYPKGYLHQLKTASPSQRLYRLKYATISRKMRKQSVRSQLMNLLQGHHIRPDIVMKKLRLNSQTFPLLVKMAKSAKSNPLVRSRAMSFLRYFPSAKVSPVLVAILAQTQTSTLLKSNALGHLVSIDPAHAKVFVHQYLKSPHYLLREVSIRSLKQFPKWIDIHSLQLRMTKETSPFLKSKLKQLLPKSLRVSVQRENGLIRQTPQASSRRPSFRRAFKVAR